MAMTVLITLTTAGADTGPFNLYSNTDGYVTPFETGVSKASLVAGYTSILVPDVTTTIRVKSTALCTNYVDLPVASGTTTTTTTAAPATYKYYLADVYNCSNCGLGPYATNVLVAVTDPASLTLGKFYSQIGVFPVSEVYYITNTSVYFPSVTPIMDPLTESASCVVACAIV